MRIFLAGATGAVGQPVVKRLLESGHNVVGLTHSKERAEKLLEQGATPAIADIFDAQAIRAAVMSAKPEIVIDMLTALPKHSYTPKSMQDAAEQDKKVRIDGGANILAGAIASGAERYIVQSAAFLYAPGSSLADEEMPFVLQASRGIAHSVDIYTEIEQRTLNSPLESSVLRFGFFYGPGTWYNPDGDVADQARDKKLHIINGGKGVWSFIHVDDAAEAIFLSLDKEPGVYNVTDSTPVEVSQWLPAFAQWVGAPKPENITKEEALRTEGPDFVYYATHLRGASNAKAKEKLKFNPRPLEWLKATSKS